MAITISLTAQLRDASIKPKALRRSGAVPAVIYGHGFDPQHLQFEYRTIDSVVRQAGQSHLVSLGVEGGEDHTVLIREVQRDPLKDRIIHVDLYRVLAGEEITGEVPLVQRGESPAVELGGIVNQILGSLEIECLPKDLPEAIEIDLSRLVRMGSHLTVADLSIPEGVKVLTPADSQVIGIIAPRGLEEEEAEAEELEGAAEEDEERSEED